MSKHRPPQPPDGVYPVGNRHAGPIPSVPELQAYRDKLLAYTFLRGLGGLDDGWYSVMRDLERSEQALDDARWRLACASWRWVRYSDSPGRDDERMWWFLQSIFAASRFHLKHLPDYYCPGRELALRPKTEVAPWSAYSM